MSSIRSRLQKLEAVAHPEQRLVVVDGHSDEEHDAKIEALISAGSATDRDLFVCIRLFSDQPYEGSQV